MTDLNTLNQTGVGSTDWTGYRAPAGGVHTGTAKITMRDNTQFTVASNRAEVLRKLDTHAIAPTGTVWVAFDLPHHGVPIVINIGNIVGVS